MSETFRMYLEIGFNTFYLIAIWSIVAVMLSRKKRLTAGEWNKARPWVIGLALLALGDTGHVGFRIVAYAMGDLALTIPLGSITFPLVGAGALATAVTVTMLYFLMLEGWRRRNDKPRSVVYWLFGAILLFRLVIMLFPQNQWEQIVPPFDWSLFRNLPLTIVGLCLAAFFLKDGFKQSDGFQKRVGLWICLSFLFYLPVILLVQQIPLVGMLMIPKTVAYLLIALEVKNTYFPKG